MDTIEIPSLISSTLKCHQHRHPVKLEIFPDSGASICLAGPKLIKELGIQMNELIPSSKQVKAVGGSILRCQGWLPLSFQIENRVTKQPVYICNKIDRIYLSKKGCIETNILPKCFPYPMNLTTTSVESIETNKTQPPSPNRPLKLPFPPTEENIPKLEEYLRKAFNNTAFNKAIPFPIMAAPPAHIHLQSNSKPYVRHTPNPVPLHWKEEVKKGFGRRCRKRHHHTSTDWNSSHLVQSNGGNSKEERH